MFVFFSGHFEPLTSSKIASPVFKREAIASIAHHDASNEVIYPHRQHTRLRISVLNTSQPGTPRHVRSATLMDENTLDGSLRIAQQEIVEQEIFTLLSREAGNLPTASARVSERLIAIDVAQSAELRFELVAFIRLFSCFQKLISYKGRDRHWVSGHVLHS